MFKSFWGSQEQQAESRPEEVTSDSWYPPSVSSSASNSRPGSPSTSSSSAYGMQRPGDRPHSLSHVPPSEAAAIMSSLKDKSVDDLRKLLSDKDAYKNLLLSLDPVKNENHDELQNATLQLARENLGKESLILQLKNQCSIIRTTELAAAQERLHELCKQKEQILTYYSPASLLYWIQETMNQTEEESEALHRKLLEGEIDISTFLQKYRKLRLSYHKRALTHLAATTSLTG